MPPRTPTSPRWARLPAVSLLVLVLTACASAGVEVEPSAPDSPAGAPSWRAEPADVAIEVTGDELAVLEDPAADAAVGVEIPTVTGLDVNGAPIVIGPTDGPMAIMVVAHWCPHCQAEVALLSDHLRVNGLPDDVRVVAISSAIDATRGNFPSARWLAEAEWPVDTLIDDADSTALRAFGIAAFPSLVLVDEAGAVTLRVTGSLDGPRFEQALDILRDG